MKDGNHSSTRQDPGTTALPAGAPSRALTVATVLAASVLATALSLLLLYQSMLPAMNDERERLAQTTMAQLADQLADLLLRDDLISLNVAIAEAVQRGQLQSAAVYSADNRLLASAGDTRAARRSPIHVTEIPYQDAIIGQLRITLPASPARQRLLRLGTAIAVINLATAIGALCLLLSGQPWNWSPWPASRRPHATADGQQDILQLLLKHQHRAINLAPDAVRDAVELYDGALHSVTRDDIVIYFPDGEEAVLAATCCASLLLNMQRLSSSTGELRGVLQIGNDEDELTRHAQYLAGLGRPNSLLVTPDIKQRLADQDQIALSEFHSGLAPEHGLYEVTGMQAARRDMIEKQAHHLMRDGG